MKVVKRGTKYWITGCPDCEDMGDYDSKEEAESDMRGVARSMAMLEKLEAKEAADAAKATARATKAAATKAARATKKPV